MFLTLSQPSVNRYRLIICNLIVTKLTFWAVPSVLTFRRQYQYHETLTAMIFRKPFQYTPQIVNVRKRPEMKHFKDYFEFLKYHGSKNERNHVSTIDVPQEYLFRDIKHFIGRLFKENVFY
jgi:hypothetical protein